MMNLDEFAIYSKMKEDNQKFHITDNGHRVYIVIEGGMMCIVTGEDLTAMEYEELADFVAKCIEAAK